METWERTADDVFVRKAEDTILIAPSTRLRVDSKNGTPESWWFICSGALPQFLGLEAAKEAALQAALDQAKAVVATLEARLSSGGEGHTV